MNLGGTYEQTITEALDLVESARLWEPAEQGKRWLDSLSEDERADRRARHDALDQAFSSQ